LINLARLADSENDILPAVGDPVIDGAVDEVLVGQAAVVAGPDHEILDAIGAAEVVAGAAPAVFLAA